MSLFLVILLSIAMFAVASHNDGPSRNSNYSSSNDQKSLTCVNTTLIADTGNFRVIEIDNSGNIIWQKTGLGWPVDAERLANGNTLIAEHDNNRIIEVDKVGNIVWNLNWSGIGLPSIRDVERLSNGNTLVTDSWNAIEVDNGGNVVWQYSGFKIGMDGERLTNGSTLIAIQNFNNRIIEVDSTGNKVWQRGVFSKVTDVERLTNGNTLITHYNWITEVDPLGNIVWQKTGLTAWDAERLDNGNTLISNITVSPNVPGSVLEVDTAGNIVWQIHGLNNPMDVERLSTQAPTTINATIDFDPDTLNLKSKGKWVTVYIELPSGYNVSDINASSVLLNSNLIPVLNPKYGFVKSESSYIMDHDGDGIMERMLKFERTNVQNILQVGDSVEIKITGKINGQDFEGIDIIRVINPPK